MQGASPPIIFAAMRGHQIGITSHAGVRVAHLYVLGS